MQATVKKVNRQPMSAEKKALLRFIMRHAWRLVKRCGVSLSQAMRRAWATARMREAQGAPYTVKRKPSTFAMIWNTFLKASSRLVGLPLTSWGVLIGAAYVVLMAVTLATSGEVNNR